MTPPFVSVIILVYNDPERLKTCLQALEEQTYFLLTKAREIEYICVYASSPTILAQPVWDL